ncbi:hypothetical protein V493_01594, partial [Pseudogymnoascus sp. VKM F-4281 (FW-2241)]
MASIFSHLESQLPSYAVPKSIIPISHLPLTASGEVDTEALGRSYGVLRLGEVGRGYGNPDAAEMGAAGGRWTEVEEVILAAVTSVVASRSPQTPPITIKPNTPFSALGIDSIAAIGLVRRLREAGVKVDV